jgi:hypothetical protein
MTQQLDRPRRHFGMHPWRVGVLALGCVSTELEPGLPSPVSCADSVDDSVARDAVVLVNSQIGARGESLCSGVLIAPRLVVTGYACVAGFNDPQSSDPRGPRPPLVYSATIDHDAACDRKMAWSAVEDGSFSAAIGRLLEPRAVTVYAGNGVEDASLTATAYPVERLFTSRATTTCKDNLAVLLLQAPVPVAPVPVRLDGTTWLQETALMSGFCVAPSSAVVNEAVLVNVEDITFGEATPDAPPRSLVLSKTISEFAYGGGVFAWDTGALVAIIASGDSASCGQAADGPSFASRIAAYRRLIIDAARDSDQTLHAELAAGAGGAELPHCDSLTTDANE